MARHRGAQNLIITWISGFLPGSEDFIKILSKFLDLISGAGGLSGCSRYVGMFWTASAIFGGITRSINRAWDVNRKTARSTSASPTRC